MKRTSPLWGSISILIGVVIAILSLLRGNWATVALITVFAVWGLWLIFTQLLPAWRSNRTYRCRVRQSRDRQEAVLDTSDSGMGLVLLRHVNHRIKVAPLEAEAAPNQQPVDPRVWYEFQDRSILEDMIADLRSRGHSSLTLNEDGSICIQPADGGEEIKKDSFAAFPEKVYWPRLAKVLEQEGLTADVQDTRILVSW